MQEISEKGLGISVRFVQTSYIQQSLILDVENFHTYSNIINYRYL